MKRIITLTLVCAAICGCSDDGSILKVKVLGNWNWTMSSGGFTGTTTTPESTGSEMRLEISKDTIRGYLNGSLSFETTYTIETRKSALSGGRHEMIMYGDGRPDSRIHIDGNTLILTDECSDCFTRMYVRIEK